MRPLSITMVPHRSPDWRDSVPLFLLSARICRMSVRAKSLKSPLSSMCVSSFGNDPGHEFSQLGHGDGFGQIAVGSHTHSQLDVFFRTLGADNDYRQILAVQFRPDPADELEAIHVRHPDVGQDQIKLSIPDLIKSVLAVNGLGDVGFRNTIQSVKAHAEQLPECG